MEEKKFSYQVALSIKVGQYLRAKGYTPADPDGKAHSQLSDTGSLGILKIDPEVPAKRNVLSNRVVKEPKKAFIGLIRLGTQRDITNVTDWTIEVYGEKNVSELTQLSRELMATFDASINLRLVQEQQRLEYEFSD